MLLELIAETMAKYNSDLFLAARSYAMPCVWKHAGGPLACLIVSDNAHDDIAPENLAAFARRSYVALDTVSLVSYGRDGVTGSMFKVD